MGINLLSSVFDHYKAQPRFLRPRSYCEEGFYDPTTGSFIQPGLAGGNRYSYANNNPINFNDPSGLDTCSEEGRCIDQNGNVYYNGKLDNSLKEDSKYYQNLIKNTFGWETADDLSLEQLEIIMATGEGIASYIFNNTTSNGFEWMINNLGNVRFVYDNAGTNILGTSFVGPSDTVNLKKDFQLFDKNNPCGYVGHELGHIFDNKRGDPKTPATWYGGGPADYLAGFAGISPLKQFPRWSYNHPTIPVENQFLDIPSTWGGYGNYDTADYFAESFSRIIFDPTDMPINWQISLWIKSYISLLK